MPDETAMAAVTGERVEGAAIERVRFDVPGWVRRGGTNSWLLIGMAGALTLAVVAFAATRDLTVPLVMGVFLGIVFAPIVGWLADRGVNRALGAVIVLVGLVITFVGVGYVTASALSGQSDALRQNLDEAVTEISSWAADLPISDDSVADVDASARDAGPALRDGAATAIATAIDSAAGFVAGLVLGTMVLYYMLKDGPVLIARWVARKKDPAVRAAAQRLVERSIHDVQSYFAGKTQLALVNGVSIAFGMYVVGVPGALAIGVVNVIGAYIPYIGAFIGGAFAVLMALGDGGVGLALVAFAIVMVAQLGLENLLEPRLLGSSLNIHPLTVLLATTFGGLVGGMIGLILAAPALAIGKDLVNELRDVGFFDDATETPPRGEPTSDG